MYHTLKTKPIVMDKQSISNMKQKIMKTLFSCFESIAFSTYPYIMKHYNSKQALRHTNSGNCVTLSLYIKQMLQHTYGIKSYLIPATVPSEIMKDDYLDICHVAVAIPINSYSYYIVDPAFYFMEPIHVNINKEHSNPIRATSIYTDTIDTVRPVNKCLTSPLVLNDYQRIPNKSNYCECSMNDISEDTWKYFLREIINPDQAITSFFIAVRHEPFFVSTTIEDGICKKDLILRVHDGTKLSIKLNNDVLYDSCRFDIPSDMINYVGQLLDMKGIDRDILFY